MARRDLICSSTTLGSGFRASHDKFDEQFDSFWVSGSLNSYSGGVYGTIERILLRTDPTLNPIPEGLLDTCLLPKLVLVAVEFPNPA